MSTTFDPRPFDIETFNTIQTQLKWIGFDGTVPASFDRIEMTRRDCIVQEHLDPKSTKPYTTSRITVTDTWDLDFIEYTWMMHKGWWLMTELLKWQKRIQSFGDNKAVLKAFAKHDHSGALSRMALTSAKKAELKVRSLRMTRLWLPWHRKFDICTESQRQLRKADVREDAAGEEAEEGGDA